MDWLRKYYRLRDKALPYGTRRRHLVKSLFKPMANKVKNLLFECRNEYSLTDFKIDVKEGLIILTTEHCLFIAKEIKETMDKINIPSEIICKRPSGGFKKLPHIVICPQMFSRLPDMYVSFQMEQSVSSRWFTKDYMKKLKQSVAIFDYSLTNIAFLLNEQLPLSKIYYLPISPNLHIQKDEPNKEYDVAFYGDTNCDRRNKILNDLKKDFKIKIINSLFGEELYAELKKAKIIINIHYYEGALLETTRIYECISLGTSVIISEDSPDVDEYEEIKHLVEFVAPGDIEDLKNKIKLYLNNADAYYDKLKTNLKILNQTHCSNFEYYFYRFLLATDNMAFDNFYDLTSAIELKGNWLCLGLPEAVERHAAFEKDNRYGITYFPGLRHYNGWIGCGLSYKYMLRKAADQEMQEVTICEDDVEFSELFDKRINNIEKYLHNNKKWDIFTGVIADVANDTQVLCVENYNGENIIRVDRIVSMVFNIYNASSLKMLEPWDNMNMNAENNTIDRFIEQSGNAQFVTTIPFLVGCKNELNSTLWGFDNSVYDKMIEQSEKKLTQKVDMFLKGKVL